MYYADVKNRSLPAEFDRALAWSATALLALGLVMVYSSSIAIAEGGRITGQQPMYYLMRHGVFLALSTCLATVAFQLPTGAWQRAAPFLFLFGAGLLVLVLVPGVGREVNGSQRWLSLYLFNLQPSEFMKLFAVLYAADYTVRKSAHMHSLTKGFLPLFIVMLLVGGLLLREPDFGAFAVITIIAMGILFLGGVNWKPFAGLIALLVVGFVLLIWLSPYRMQRVVGFMDPWADPFGKGYQLSHALIAFGRGEWLGVGLGASVEKLFYLPEAHTDFLLAVIAEELGFAGVALVIALFVTMIVRAFAIGRQAAALERNFPALVAQGIGLWLGVQAIINMGVNMGVLPTKGLTLPLLSFGGSGIAANCCALAVLLRVDWENRRLMRGLVA
jgi:cell division protein FtsW